MAIILRPYEIVSRILQKYPLINNRGYLLRFEEQMEFSQDHSCINPSQFIRLIEKVKLKGFTSLGGYTEKGVYRLLKDVEDYIRDFLENKREKIGFINLYWIYFYRPTSPSGILVIVPYRFIFIPGLTEITQELFIDYTFQSADRKQKLSSIAKERKLKWWGDVRSPVIFRDCEINVNNFEIFLEDVLAFFEKVGYAEV